MMIAIFNFFKHPDQKNVNVSSCAYVERDTHYMYFSYSKSQEIANLNFSYIQVKFCSVTFTKKALFNLKNSRT